MHIQVCAHKSSSPTKASLKLLFRVLLKGYTEQKNDVGAALGAQVSFNTAVLICTTGNGFQKFPGFQSLNEQRVVSTQT